MSDRLRVVTLPRARRPVLVAELNAYETAGVSLNRETLQITPPPAKPRLSSSPTPYGGARAVGVSRDNGQLQATFRVRGATAEQAIARVEDRLALIDRAPADAHIEWRPMGLAHSTFYELRGPGGWTPKYDGLHFAQGQSLDLELTWPIAPLARWLDMDVDDDFTVDSLADYTVDAGGGTLSVAGGLLVPSSTVEKRLRHTARGYAHGDCEATLKVVPSTAGLQTALVCLVGLDAANHLYAGLAAGALVIGKRDAGANTDLSSSSPTTYAPTAGQPYWVRGRREGNTVVVEYFTSEPTPMATPAQTRSHTLTGADATKFGSGSGAAGVRWAPVSVADRVDDFQVRPFTWRARTLPATMPRFAVPGSAPARVGVEVTPSGGSQPPKFALVGWSAAEAQSGAALPFGVLDSSAAPGDAGFAETANGVYAGDTGKQLTAAGAGSAELTWDVDPAALGVDDFSDQLAIELWARLRLASTLVGLRASAYSRGGTYSYFFTAEYGGGGKVIGLPSSGTVERTVRLGVVPIGGEVATQLAVAFSWLTGSTGVLGVDYLLCVPARRRFYSPTGIPSDAAYPDFVPDTAERRRRIDADGRGWLDGYGWAGLAGGPMELEPGDNLLAAKLSSLVPDDPFPHSASEQESHTATVHLAVTPRARLARAA